MFEFLSKMESVFLVPIVALVCTAITIIICVVTHRIASTWRSHKSQELSASLIESMIVSGMSAEEIEKVLKAAGFEDSEDPKRQQNNNHSKKNMAETKIGVKIG